MRGIPHKQPKSDIKKNYRLFYEFGIILALIILLVLFKIPFHPSNNQNFTQPKQETVHIKQVPETKQHKTPPPPPRPQTPQPVPNNEVIKSDVGNLSSELNINQSLNVPPPPGNGKNTNKKTQKNKVFKAVQKEPQLIGGLKALQKKINYPPLARKAGIEGTVYVQFVVDKQGNVENAHVIRGVAPVLNKEALRVVKQSKFKPGIQRGRPVKVQYSLPIVFRLKNK